MFTNKKILQSVIFFWGLMVALNALATSVANEEIAYLRLSDGYWQVWLTDAKGISHRQITRDSVDKTRVSWFPNRAQLLVNSNDGVLSIINVKSLHKKIVPLSSLEVFDAKLSPDGQQITYTATTSLQADNAEVWMANIDGTEKQKITNNTSVALTPSWNIHHKSVLFSAGNPGSNQEIWEVFLNDKKSEQVTAAKSTSIDPSANKDGEILYSSNRTGNYSIWWIDQSQKQHQLTQSTGFDAQPTWSPSGKYFAFYRLTGTKKQIWVHDMSTNQEHAITPDNVLSRFPSWIE